MKERKYVLGALVACLVIVASSLAGLAAAKPGKKQAAFKVAWIYPGPHNDGGWSQAHDAGRLAVEKALGSKVQTTYKENVFSNASVPQIVAGLVRDGYNMIFATSFGMFELGVNGQLADEVPERPLRAGDRHSGREEPGRVLRRGRGHDLPVRHGRRRRDQEGRDRLRGALRHPRGRPSPQRLHPRRPGHASGREGEDRLDERVVLAAEGDGRREGARQRRRRRDRTERRQPRRRCLRREGRSPVGRLRLGREEVRAEAVADRSGLRLGLVLRPPRQGGDQRHLEAGLLLRLGQGRLHGPGALRAEGLGEDEGRDRREEAADPLRQVARVLRPDLRPERQAEDRRRASASTRTRRRGSTRCTPCSGS